MRFSRSASTRFMNSWKPRISMRVRTPFMLRAVIMRANRMMMITASAIAEHPQPGLSEVNMEEISSENKWSSGDHSAENPVGVCALGIERVHAFFFQRRHHIGFNGLNGNVETIAQIGDVCFRLPGGKQVFHHHAFEWSEIVPLVRPFELHKDVVLLVKDDHLRDFLFANLDVAANSQIDKSRSDVARIGGVIDQRSHFGNAHDFRWLVPRRHGNPGAWIAALSPPQREHYDERNDGKKNDWVAEQ